MYTVTITFTESAFEAESKARFEGLHRLPQWVDGFISIEASDGTVYAYNATRVARVKIVKNQSKGN